MHDRAARDPERFVGRHASAGFSRRVRAHLEGLAGQSVKVNIMEVRKPDISAQLVMTACARGRLRLGRSRSLDRLANIHARRGAPSRGRA